jgi:hypothetical protein
MMLMMRIAVVWYLRNVKTMTSTASRLFRKKQETLPTVVPVDALSWDLVVMMVSSTMVNREQAEELIGRKGLLLNH